MKKTILLTLMTVISFMASAQVKILLTVGENTMTASLADNEATRSLCELLGKGPVTVSMEDYGGFEKVGALPWSLPTSNTQITTVPGDIMLYQGNNIVIFYGSNSWSYTRLGKVDAVTVNDLRQFLGNGRISLTISLAEEGGVEDIISEDSENVWVYDLKGNLITSRPLSPGIYVINGKKTIVR